MSGIGDGSGAVTKPAHASVPLAAPCPEARDVDAVALVPKGGFFEGQVALQGRTQVEGAVRGSLRGSGELVLSAEARVEGLVECDVVSCSGTIIGPVAVRIRAYFGDGAHFDGDLDAPRLEIEGDVVWNGIARVGG